MTFWRAFALGSWLLALVAQPVLAQEETMFQRYRPPPKGTSDTYIVTLSASGALEPRFPGSDKATLNVFPSLSYRRSDEPPRFAAVDDGASISIIDDPTFRIGPVFRLQSGRYLSDDRRLFGLRKLDFDVESGLFIEYWPLTFIRARMEVRHGFRGSTGFVGNGGVDVVVPFGGSFVFAAGPRIYLGDERYNDRFFGVRPFEAALSRGRFFAYSPDGGFNGVGAIGALTYRWSPTWAATAYVNYKRLVGDVADSPLVTRGTGSKDQLTVGLRISYSFSYTPGSGLASLP